MLTINTAATHLIRDDVLRLTETSEDCANKTRNDVVCLLDHVVDHAVDSGFRLSGLVGNDAT